LERDAVAAVYSRHRSLRPRPSPALVLRHERVVEAMMERGPVLPLRFGTQLSDEEDLALVLAERGEELWRALERVRGRVELGLRVMPASESGHETDSVRSSGRGYLLALSAEQRRTDRAATDLHAPLASLAAESVVRQAPAPPAIFVAAYLVDANRVAEFRSRADALVAGDDDLRAVVTGPWPPYNFAAESPG
jgi:hypothetical protein